MARISCLHLVMLGIACAQYCIMKHPLINTKYRVPNVMILQLVHILNIASVELERQIRCSSHRGEHQYWLEATAHVLNTFEGTEQVLDVTFKTPASNDCI